MTDTPKIPEGFIRHDGGKCPVPLDASVSIMFADGMIDDGWLPARYWAWGRALPCNSWIIAYKPAPNYTPPIDWQARAEAAEAELAALRVKAEKLATALKGIMEWAGPIAGDNNDDVAAEEEISSADLARAALAEWENSNG